MPPVFIRNLYKWYAHNKREHPWLGSGDAYLIWLSEVIMQQTRIEQGTSYYLKFVKLFPTVYHLAAADESFILKLWEGLGYYSRARNLLTTAKEIVAYHNGQFPKQFHEIIKLKGIGSYTASAILSFAYQLPYPVIDGNVMRIFARYFGIREPVDSPEGKKKIELLADKLMDKKNPGLYNQAIMDFGALVCTPRSPQCIECPVSKNCFAYQNDQVALFPVKIKKAKRKKRYFNYLVFTNGNSTLIEQRKTNDIWKGLFQFPLIEASLAFNQKELISSPAFKKIWGTNSPVKIHSVRTIQQQLTHQDLTVRFFLIETNDLHRLAENNYLFISRTGLKKYAFPGAIRDYLSEIITFRFDLKKRPKPKNV